jgi:hypothetical protein
MNFVQNITHGGQKMRACDIFVNTSKFEFPERRLPNTNPMMPGSANQDISIDQLDENIGGLDISHVRHQDISSSSILNQMRDLDSISLIDNDPKYL